MKSPPRSKGAPLPPSPPYSGERAGETGKRRPPSNTAHTQAPARSSLSPSLGTPGEGRGEGQRPKKNKHPTSKKSGRPLSFNPDQALDLALTIFWRQGYEGATLPALTRAMGINRPSLYSTFGNKQSLFKKALDRYSHGPASYVRLALAQPTARKVAESLLYGAIDLIARPHHPKGCLMVQGALSCSDSNDCIRRELASRRLAAQSALRRRLDRAKKEGDLPKSANPAALAQYLATILHGLSVQAATGATPAQLRQVVATALGAWPT